MTTVLDKHWHLADNDYEVELLTLTKSISTDNTLADVSRVLNLMSGMYDQASCIAAAHRIAP